MKTLTPQILGMYIGQKCRHMGCPDIVTITGLSYDSTQKIWWVYFDNEEDDYAILSDVFPILRRLSDMTEEEYATVSRMAGTEKDFDFESAQGRALLTDYINSSRCNVTGQTWIKIGNYLRSIGVDCDNLLDSGLAVENNQHPTK